MDKIYKSDEWETLVPMTELQPGYDATRLHFFPVKDTNKVEIICFFFRCTATQQHNGNFLLLRTFQLVTIRHCGSLHCQALLSLVEIFAESRHFNCVVVRRNAAGRNPNGLDFRLTPMYGSTFTRMEALGGCALTASCSLHPLNDLSASAAAWWT